jgi:hypothetical protein
VAYCHEMAHVFVTLLSFKHRQTHDIGTPPIFRLPYIDEEDEDGNPMSPKGQAGTVLENIMLGGIYYRARDNSGWDEEAMV